MQELRQPRASCLWVTGGKPLGNDIPEAAQMRAVLEQEFKVPVRWVRCYASPHRLHHALPHRPACFFAARPEALRDSKIFMHEIIGLLWYRLKS